LRALGKQKSEQAQRRIHRAACAFILLLSLQSAPAAKREDSKVINVLCLGDSLTAGYGLSRAQAFPALLAEKARAGGYACDFINAGVNGETTGGGLRRLPNFLRHKTDVLIIELGINDAFRGIAVETQRANLQAIIDQTRAKWPNAQIVISGMQVPLFANDPYVLAFSEMFSGLAEKNHTALIPFFLERVGGDPTLNQSDRIHPNAAGQRVLADNVWRVLEPVLQKIASANAAARVE
jgi:acyl-CoA thioesterase-1